MGITKASKSPYREIILTQRQVTKVDPEDYEKYKFKRWYACWDDKMDGYVAQRNVTLADGTRKTIYLHREIICAPKGLVVDHINHDILDNRKENLRTCTHAQNMLNRRIYINNSTGYKGVQIKKGAKSKPFSATIRANNKKIFIGYYKTPEEAAHAYNEAAVKYHGEFAHLNKI